MLARALLLLASYILGSVPFGVLIAKTKGVDLKTTGSGNIGATNVLRGMGKGAALFTFLGDSLKGTAAVIAARYMGFDVLWQGLAGFCAVLGHNFSFFLGGRGGKGVATSIGVAAALSPLAGLFAVCCWLAVAVLTKFSSLAAIVSFTLLPLFIIGTGIGRGVVPIAAALAALILLRHAGNIKRLLEGRERRIGEKAS